MDETLYFHTGGDGRFKGTSPDDMRAALAKMREAGRGVIHLHGGLVAQDAALAGAERMAPLYQAAGAHPLFAVWESGLWETIRNNFTEIGREAIFRQLFRKLLKWAIGKLTDGTAKSAALPFPNDLELRKAEKRLEQEQEPYESFQPASALSELDDKEAAAFRREVEADPEIGNAVRAIVLTRSTVVPTTDAARSAAVAAGTGETHLDARVLDELRADNADGTKALFTWAKLAWRAAKVLARVIKRFVRRTDHGVYATVVEELLRELYLDDVGGLVWGSMKQDTADTFDRVSDGQPRAGWTLVDEIGALCAQANPPSISIVAHSAGSIYACHLLKALRAAQKDPLHPLPPDFRLKSVAFLAPAVRFDLFGQTLQVTSELFQSFRMFTMRDELEAAYWEVPVLYPRSLLYFVSGVVERNGDSSHDDCPLVGMERYYDEERYPDVTLDPVRAFMRGTDRVAWSPTDGVTMANRHGEFDDDAATMKSVMALL